MSQPKLYKDYFQKSRVFLYAGLNLRTRGIIPVDTFVSWKDLIKPRDMKLICTYTLLYEERYEKFEREVLMKHPQFESFWHIEEGKAAYIFDFSKHKDVWEAFLMGRYSTLPQHWKNKILAYYKDHNHKIILGHAKTWLNPDEFYWLYSELLKVKEEHIRYAGELCDVPNFEKELLVSERTGFEITKNVL